MQALNPRGASRSPDFYFSVAAGGIVLHFIPPIHLTAAVYQKHDLEKYCTYIYLYEEFLKGGTWELHIKSITTKHRSSLSMW